jgi:hypothetical protein
MNKLLITSLGSLALSVATLAITAGNAQAYNLTLQINNGTFTNGVPFSGTFGYNTVTNTYSNWNLIAPAGSGGITTSFTYTTSNSFSPAVQPSDDLISTVNTPSFFSVSQSGLPSPSTRNYRTLALAFNNPLSAFTNIGEGTTINVNDSIEALRAGSNIQTRAVTGGTVVVIATDAVPEPLTILGAATAVGFGAAFKRRALKNNKKA